MDYGEWARDTPHMPARVCKTSSAWLTAVVSMMFCAEAASTVSQGIEAAVFRYGNLSWPLYPVTLLCGHVCMSVRCSDEDGDLPELHRDVSLL